MIATRTVGIKIKEILIYINYDITGNAQNDKRAITFYGHATIKEWNLSLFCHFTVLLFELFLLWYIIDKRS